MWGPKPNKSQFDDAPPGATPSGPITGPAGPVTTNAGASVDNNFAYWEKMGYKMKAMGRGQIMEERKKQMGPEFEDELVKKQLEGSSSLVLDDSWLKSQELDENKRKWKELLSTPQASSSNPYDGYAAVVDPYAPTAAPKFVMKEEDFPPL